MKYHYEAGSVRWFRHDSGHDIRSHRSPNGWEAHAELIDYHPITGKSLRRSEWWIRESLSMSSGHETLRELCEVSLRCLREDEYPELREQFRQALCHSQSIASTASIESISSEIFLSAKCL